MMPPPVDPFGRFPDGHAMAVGRPANAKLAIAMAKKVGNKMDADAMDTIRDACGPYTVVGFVGRAQDKGRPVLLDTAGECVGRVKPGDSFMRVEGATKVVSTSTEAH